MREIIYQNKTQRAAANPQQPFLGGLSYDRI